ncbi:MAG: DMT family transporter [Halochromatium sp.]|uniref:DMT family transporter n=1 Tax=Halochromatium sp. TaxID=2049430 RepID=UPI003978B9A4
MSLIALAGGRRDHSRRPQSLLLGAAFIVLGECCFASMGVCIRIVSAELPNAMVVFGRNLIGLMLLAPWLLRHGVGDVKTRVPGLHLLRAVAGVAAMYCFFHAIAELPLAEAMLLKLTAPIFIPLIAIAWLHERVASLLWVALGIGFAGVILILEPDPSRHWAGVSPVALIGLLGGVLAAVAKVTVRRLSHSEPIGRIVFYFALIGGSISALPLFWNWQMPSPSALLWLLGIGIAATLGQLALTRGLSLAPASRMGAFGYFSVVFGAGYGWLFWDEPLTLSLLLGTLLIAVGGLLASRSRRLETTPICQPSARADLAGKPAVCERLAYEHAGEHTGEHAAAGLNRLRRGGMTSSP